MTPNEYQQAAKSTLATDNERDTIVMCGLGVAGEAGECADIIKKGLFHRGRPLDKEKLALEMGDLLWYVAIMTDTLNIEMQDIAPVLSLKPDKDDLARIGLRLANLAGNIAVPIAHFFSDGRMDVSMLRADIKIMMVMLEALALIINTTLETIMQRNIDKLAARHKADGAATGFTPHYQSDSTSNLI